MDQIVKAYQYEGGNLVILTEEDFKLAAVEATQAIEISDFVSLDSIEYKYFEKPYYVVPRKKAEKGFVLLREVLKRMGKVAISKVVIRSRQYLSALIPEGNAMVLVILRYYQELRDQSEFDFPAGSLEDYKISEREIEIAGMLVETMTSEWDPKQYHDEYRDALMDWIERKAQSGGLMPSPQEAVEREENGKVVDMMEILKRSVERAGALRNKRAKAKGDEQAA